MRQILSKESLLCLHSFFCVHLYFYFTTWMEQYENGKNRMIPYSLKSVIIRLFSELIPELRQTHILLIEVDDPETRERLARLEGLEPPTRCLEGSCSIRLSYRRAFLGLNQPVYINEPKLSCSLIGEIGFEPTTSCSQGRRANQAALLPGYRKRGQVTFLQRGTVPIFLTIRT